MGKIWLLQSNGKQIHMEIAGNDYNTTDTPTKISANAVSAALADRCLSGNVVVNIAGVGNITFVFDSANRTGSCTQCGSCCVHPVANCTLNNNCGYVLDTKYNVHKCQYLDIKPGQNKLGSANGTSCTIRANLVDSYKGCLYSPEKADELKPWMNNCGFSFSA